MQFSTVLITLMATLATATPTPTGDSKVAPEPNFEEESGVGWVDGPAPSKRGLEVRGFGCPWDEMRCHRHVSEKAPKSHSNEY